MNEKPIISINKFTGMGEGGILSCEGFYPETDNGKSVMSEGFYTSSILTSATTGFTNLGTITSVLSLASIFSRTTVYQLYLNSAGKFLSYIGIGTDIVKGEIHSGANSIVASDMIETANNNILYTGLDYIGSGSRSKATGGSTTTLVDTTKDFTVLGIAANDKVTNLKTGIEYTVNSISGAGNSTLNFTANGANTNAANNEYIVWNDNAFDIITTALSWQPQTLTWVKQIKQYGSVYMFTNGNWLGEITAAETSVDPTFKQLPYKHQALCFETNVSMILVSAEFNGKGVLLLWDGYSDGWNNILEIDSPVVALKRYKQGWTYVLNGIAYFTDGYQIVKLSSINQSQPLQYKSINPINYNSLIVFNNFLLCLANANDGNLFISGVYAIDLSDARKGWTEFGVIKTTHPNGLGNCISLINQFSGFQTIQVGGNTFVSNILYGEGGAIYNDKSLLMYIDLPQSVSISGVGINLTRYLKLFNQDTSSLTRDIQVSIGDGSRGLISRVFSTATGFYTTNKVRMDETLYLDNQIGDEIFISDTASPLYGERAFITANSNPGTATTDYTISPAVSGASAAATTLKILRLKKLERKTISNIDLNKEVMFYGNGGNKSNKIFIEIVSFGQTNALPLNIADINIYGN